MELYILVFKYTVHNYKWTKMIWVYKKCIFKNHIFITYELTVQKAKAAFGIIKAVEFHICEDRNSRSFK